MKAFDVKVMLEVVCIWAENEAEAEKKLGLYLCPGLEIGEADVEPASLSDAEAREFAMNPEDAP